MTPPGAHVVYLAVITVLVIVVAYLGGRMARATSVAAGIKRRYGIDPGARASHPRPGMLRDIGTADLMAERSFDQYRREVDALIARAVELGDFNDRAGITHGPVPAGGNTLQAACAQALKGGKRLRPIILMEIARMVSKRRHAAEQMPPVDPADAAIAVECFHAGSLVVDDLPAFDGDRERRGEPSLWVARGESTALMSAIAIMAGAFQNVCRQVDWMRDNCGEWVNPDRVGMLLCNQLSTSLGVLGAASGQFMDMLPPSGLEEFSGGDAGTSGGAVQTLVQRKTSPFFEMAFVCGWVVGGGETDDQGVLDDLRNAGRNFGTAFQIADDIGDLESDRARRESGKPGWNYADTYGREEAERDMAQRLSACRKALSAYDLDSPLWDEICGKVAGMATA
jgi:geranylgeranyl diphosphate synthase, type II